MRRGSGSLTTSGTFRKSSGERYKRLTRLKTSRAENRVLSYEKGRALAWRRIPGGVLPGERARGPFIHSPLAYGGNTSPVARRAVVLAKILRDALTLIL